jgi:hypothetical protein
MNYFAFKRIFERKAFKKQWWNQFLRKNIENNQNFLNPHFLNALTKNWMDFNYFWYFSDKFTLSSFFEYFSFKYLFQYIQKYIEWLLIIFDIFWINWWPTTTFWKNFFLNLFLNSFKHKLNHYKIFIEIFITIFLWVI